MNNNKAIEISYGYESDDYEDYELTKDEKKSIQQNNVKVAALKKIYKEQFEKDLFNEIGNWVIVYKDKLWLEHNKCMSFAHALATIQTQTTITESMYATRVGFPDKKN